MKTLVIISAMLLAFSACKKVMPHPCPGDDSVPVDFPYDPGNDDPGGDDPGYDDPGNGDPGDEDPGYDDPGYSDPGDEDPGYDDPSPDGKGGKHHGKVYLHRSGATRKINP